MSIILMQTATLEDPRPVIKLAFWFLAHKPFDVSGGTSHDGVEHEDRPACVF